MLMFIINIPKNHKPIKRRISCRVSVEKNAASIPALNDINLNVSHSDNKIKII